MSLHNIEENGSWKFGDGSKINFWSDTWLSKPATDFLEIHAFVHNFLYAKVKDFLVNMMWAIPNFLTASFPTLTSKINLISISRFEVDDHLVWVPSTTSIMTFKDAYLFANPYGVSTPFAKLI